VTGTDSMPVSIMNSPGRSGFGPQISLAHNLDNSDGLPRFGWYMSGPAIIRKKATVLSKSNIVDLRRGCG